MSVFLALAATAGAVLFAGGGLTLLGHVGENVEGLAPLDTVEQLALAAMVVGTIVLITAALTWPYVDW